MSKIDSFVRMHHLVIDIGNTNSKLAVFKDRELVEFQKHGKIFKEHLSNIISKWNVSHSSLSSVAAESENHDLIDVLRSQTEYIAFSASKTAGVQNYYESSATLGLDRWAKVIAAYHLYPGMDCLIIDAGSCITYDRLNAAGEYFGGSISLGLSMRFKALHHFTGRLPLVEWHGTAIPEGRDTGSAIQNGVLQGAVYELTGFIENGNKVSGSSTKVLFTGGDAEFLLGELKNSIFAPQIIHDPYLVLKGLNEVILFEYVQKD
ncbi:type III pantothenate kinase [Pedobacter faecalis]|uniref:type III pantothenate kinase n=1 Tax=Pedobacter faecalis TaxID=3041495 RepID=UPI00254C60B6|nr:type III pantothenate kinase [Pedobacter sp. ELA7]